MIEISSYRKSRESAQKPATAPAGTRAINSTPEGQTRPQRQLQPFTAIDGSDYRRAYREVCNYHERNNPPRLDDDGGDAYWTQATDDFIDTCRKFNDDPFIMAMMIAVLNELERQFKLLRDGHADEAQRPEAEAQSSQAM